MLTPVDRTITLVSVFVWGNLSKLWHLGKSASASKPFTSAAFADPGYVGLLAWLMTKREAKLHWEWELFNYYVYWSVFTNIAICIALALFLLWPSISLLEGLLYGAVGIMFFGFAALHSDEMALVHKHYQEQYSLAMKTAKISSPEAGLSTPDATAEPARSKPKEASS